MRIVPSVVAGLLLASVQVASADDAAGGPTYARRCGEGHPALREARAQLDQLDRAIEKAAPDAPIGPLRTQLDDLLATPCFQVADAIGELSFGKLTTLALKRWWEDGGHDWLADQLSGERTVSFPPSVRSTLSLEHSPKHPLARLLCRSTDPDCGTETAGWRARAEEAFRVRAKMNARWRGEGYTTNVYARSKPPAEDEAETLDAPLWRCAHPRNKKRNFLTWIDCVRALRTPVAMFPAGAVRAPTSGWLVVRGRRGHYQFCDQLTAYDLATGAYYASKSCSGLALEADGSVNTQRTDAARRPTIEAGRVSVDNLREAAWMMFLLDELEDAGHPTVDTFPLPPGLEPEVRDGVTQWGVDGFSVSGSSAQTTLHWTWIDGGQVAAEGKLTWPDSYRAGEDHAVELLRIAEAGFVHGCPPAPLPNPILRGCGKGGVSTIDSSAANLCKVQAELSKRLASFTCTKR